MPTKYYFVENVNKHTKHSDENTKMSKFPTIFTIYINKGD